MLPKQEAVVVVIESREDCAYVVRPHAQIQHVAGFAALLVAVGAITRVGWFTVDPGIIYKLA